jgi:NADH dehydrogenase
MDRNARSIVIVGGGFAGVYCARHLQGRLPAGWQIVLFSGENHLIFTPLLGNVVGSSLSPMHVVWPVRQMLPRCSCRSAEVNGIDLAARQVHYVTATGHAASQPFDHLVLACGAKVKLDIIPGMAAHAWPLKTMGDALVLRNHLVGLMEKAQVEPDPVTRRRLLSVVVVGGGFSGVEVAGELADLMKASCRFYDAIPPEEVKVTILQRSGRLLPELPESLGEFAARRMRARGIDVRLNAAARAVTECGVILSDGQEVVAGTVICTIGTAPNPLVTALKLSMDGGRLKTTAEMRVEGHDNVWALGDCASVPNAHDGKSSPPTAQFALRQAKCLAKNLAAVVRGQPTQPFYFKALGAFASIGDRNAVGQVFGLRFSGIVAWFLWRGIYLSKMPSLARKMQIAFDWFWEMIFPRDIVEISLLRTERLSHSHYEEGQYVFHKGEPGDRFYVVERGLAGVYLDESADEPVRLLGPGEYFGEAALLGSAPRSASVRAETPLDVLILGRGPFAELTRHLQVLRTDLERSVRRNRASDDLLKLAAEHPDLNSLHVGQVMHPAAVLPVTATLGEALRLVEGGVAQAWPVVDAAGHLMGICTRTDFAQALQGMKPARTPLAEVMRCPVVSVREGDTLAAALQLLLREPVKQVVVVADADPRHPVGLVSVLDLLKVLAVEAPVRDGQVPGGVPSAAS